MFLPPSIDLQNVDDNSTIGFNSSSHDTTGYSSETRNALNNFSFRPYESSASISNASNPIFTSRSILN